MKRFLVALVLFALFGLSSGVVAQTNILDGVYIKEHPSERKFIPYTYLREADVMWSKRIWRKMDLTQKMNHVFYYPKDNIQGRKSLMKVIYDGIVEDGTLVPYADVNDGDFSEVMTKANIVAMLNRMDTSYVPDPENPDNTIQKIYEVKFQPSSVKEFKIKEDWFFDKQRSVMDVRIIGICPVMEEDKNGSVRKKSLFWIYFPEARVVFANSEVYNRQNDAERRTIEDLFWKRQFSSFIYKESNVYDRLIQDYREGMDALAESEKIKEDIFNVEHDLWEF
jgi:gliding motility associated protien GldN